MEKIFFEYLKNEIRIKMSSKHPEFKEQQKRIKGLYTPALIYAWNPFDSFKAYIAIISVRDKNWANVLTAWSTDGHFPIELYNLVDTTKLSQFLREHRGSLKALDSWSAVLLDCGYLGRIQGGWDIPNEYSSVERAKTIYSHLNVSQYLDSIGDNDWQSIISYRAWGILDGFAQTYGLERLNETDAKYALGEMVVEINEFIDYHCLPYLRDLVERLEYKYGKLDSNC